ncbi:MAG: glycosyltransferase family 4 protein [Thermotogae bacterium]|nr:glycosyltransferase family 4 protein [Thermotogota bacterium]
MRVAILSYFFPPNNSSGAQRWAKFVKCLGERGHDVVVLANVGDLFGGEDVRRAHEMRGYARIYRFFYPLPHRPPLMVESRWREMLKLFVIPDSRLPFFVRWYRRMRDALRMESPDLLVATAPPFSALVFGRLLARDLRIPFVADLRDPWSNNPHRPNRLADTLLEGWVLKGASAVLVANDREMYDEARRFNPNVFVLEHPYDPDDYPSEPIPHPGEVWVSHVGSVFSDAQRAILESLKENLPDGYVLRLFGPGTGRILGREEAFREIISADVLLVVIKSRRKRRLGSSAKLYDYIGSGRPVVVLTDNPFLKEKARSLGLTVAETPDDLPAAIREARPPNSKRYAHRLDVACCELVRILARARLSAKRP